MSEQLTTSQKRVSARKRNKDRRFAFYYTAFQILEAVKQLDELSDSVSLTVKFGEAQDSFNFDSGYTALENVSSLLVKAFGATPQKNDSPFAAPLRTYIEEWLRKEPESVKSYNTLVEDVVTKGICLGDAHKSTLLLSKHNFTKSLNGVILSLSNRKEGEKIIVKSRIVGNNADTEYYLEDAYI